MDVTILLGSLHNSRCRKIYFSKQHMFHSASISFQSFNYRTIMWVRAFVFRVFINQLIYFNLTWNETGAMFCVVTEDEDCCWHCVQWFVPFPVVTWTKLRVLYRSLAWVCEYNSRRGHVGLSVVIAMCCQLEASASCYSLFQKSST